MENIWRKQQEKRLKTLVASRKAVRIKMGKLIAAIVFMPLCYLGVSILADFFPTLFTVAGFIIILVLAFSEGGIGCGCLTVIILVLLLIFG